MTFGSDETGDRYHFTITILAAWQNSTVAGGGSEHWPVSLLVRSPWR